MRARYLVTRTSAERGREFYGGLIGSAPQWFSDRSHARVFAIRREADHARRALGGRSRKVRVEEEFE